ncbi:ARM repeat-containing protein [Exidia glandulosa HHB12029]|uniref:ARM repeat-containing protein n=1 Tax=Exidia glandulosa HHB12029 TaxID=1314781 RepID=A0A165CYK5_EXIGL|nr:ARM repeat-containing protein [Exidia glandulosa HHB12029]
MAEGDDTIFATFDKADDFFTRLDAFLALDIATEPANSEAQQLEYFACVKLQIILGEYQEQSYLLDPYLERMVAPPVNLLRRHVNDVVNNGAPYSRARLRMLADLIYAFCRVRGSKTIVRFFPHEVTDLPTVIAYLSLPEGPSSDKQWWNLRYVMLLWLSLICMIPFDLHRFDDASSPGHTLQRLQVIGKQYISYAGIERDVSATMLARLYARKDTQSAFQEFLDAYSSKVADPDHLFTALGVLRVLSEYCNYESSEKLLSHLPSIREIADKSSALGNNSSVRKMRVKLISRMAMKLLPPPKPRRRKGRALMAEHDGNSSSSSVMDNPDMEQGDVPEVVESVVADVLLSLEDKDTQIRWSSSKALARLAERLPSDFSDQILEQILGMFSVHSWKSEDEMLDLPAAAEYTWHGACLACAEFTRRDLIPTDRLPDMIPWVIKALHFDIRKGSHSVGSSVRDAAAYVLWSLARSQDSDAIRPFADELAKELVVASLYDREVHIRRAASAAYQENVGRMGLFPDGISVLAKIDFFAVGVRRHAFTLAAADVATFETYRQALVDDLLNVVLRHWDPAMRQAGAESLRGVCAVDPLVLGPQTLRRLTAMLSSVDIYAINGALIGLSELAGMYSQLSSSDTEERHFEIFRTLSKVPENMFRSRQNDLVLEGYCLVIASSITPGALSASATAKDAAMPQWRSVIEQSLRSRTESVQEAAARAMSRASQLKECSADVKRFIRDFTGAMPTLQQGIARTLGTLAYDRHQHGVVDAIQCLLDAVDSKSPAFSQVVEARQKCYEALPRILSTLGPKISSDLGAPLVKTVFKALLAGLDDYTSDERGDVGSWIRIASISGLVAVSKLLFMPSTVIRLEDFLPDADYQAAIGGILKQGVERLDNVRADAGNQLLSLVEHEAPDGWRMEEEGRFRDLFMQEGDERTSWADASFVFPRAIQLLAIPQYRSTLAYGFVLSIGSKTDSTQRPASKALADYAASLPLTSDVPTELTLPRLVQEILDIGKRNFTANQIAVPVFQTLNVLLESAALSQLEAGPEGHQSLLGILALASKNADKLKNVQRILSAMKIVTALVPTEVVSKDAIKVLPTFLGHRFPKVRSETAETLYLVTQTRDIDAPEVEDLLLETEWTNEVGEEVNKVIQLLLDM